MVIVFRAVVDEADIPVVVYSMQSGEEAIHYLGTAQQTADVVFLDLDMPDIDGWEVLKSMDADDRLCHIPVVISTTSSRSADEEQAYSLGAEHFLTNLPRLPDSWTKLRQSIVDEGNDASSAAKGGA